MLDVSEGVETVPVAVCRERLSFAQGPCKFCLMARTALPDGIPCSIEEASHFVYIKYLEHPEAPLLQDAAGCSTEWWDPRKLSVSDRKQQQHSLCLLIPASTEL